MIMFCDPAAPTVLGAPRGVELSEVVISEAVSKLAVGRCVAPERENGVVLQRQFQTLRHSDMSLRYPSETESGRQASANESNSRGRVWRVQETGRAVRSVSVRQPRTTSWRLVGLTQLWMAGHIRRWLLSRQYRNRRDAPGVRRV